MAAENLERSLRVYYAAASRFKTAKKLMGALQRLLTAVVCGGQPGLLPLCFVSAFGAPGGLIMGLLSFIWDLLQQTLLTLCEDSPNSLWGLCLACNFHAADVRRCNTNHLTVLITRHLCSGTEHLVCRFFSRQRDLALHHLPGNVFCKVPIL